MSVAGHDFREQVSRIDPLVYAIVAGVALTVVLSVSFVRIFGLA